MKQESVNAMLLSGIYRVNNFLSKRIDNKLSMHGINYTEFLVMTFLNEQSDKQARRADLAEHIGLTASGITRLLSPMERIGLVQKEKNARDARVSLVKLTDTGQRILSESMVSVNEASENIFSTLRQKDKEKMFSEFSKLLEIRR